MHLFIELLAKPIVALTTTVMVALGGGAAVQHVTSQDTVDAQASTEVRADTHTAAQATLHTDAQAQVDADTSVGLDLGLGTNVSLTGSAR